MDSVYRFRFWIPDSGFHVLVLPYNQEAMGMRLRCFGRTGENAGKFHTFCRRRPRRNVCQ